MLLRTCTCGVYDIWRTANAGIMMPESSLWQDYELKLYFQCTLDAGETLQCCKCDNGRQALLIVPTLSKHAATCMQHMCAMVCSAALSSCMN